jgi:hypothetical protein
MFWNNVVLLGAWALMCWACGGWVFFSVYLVLPGWLNWFTANIGYHHIHHLSANIPNYRLVDCYTDMSICSPVSPG